MLILVYVLVRRGGNILLQTISTNPSEDSSLKTNNRFGLKTTVCLWFPIVCIGVVVKWWRKSVNHSIELLAIKFSWKFSFKNNKFSEALSPVIVRTNGRKTLVDPFLQIHQTSELLLLTNWFQTTKGGQLEKRIPTLMFVVSTLKTKLLLLFCDDRFWKKLRSSLTIALFLTNCRGARHPKGLEIAFIGRRATLIR